MAAIVPKLFNEGIGLQTPSNSPTHIPALIRVPKTTSGSCRSPQTPCNTPTKVGEVMPSLWAEEPVSSSGARKLLRRRKIFKKEEKGFQDARRFTRFLGRLINKLPKWYGLVIKDFERTRAELNHPKSLTLIRSSQGREAIQNLEDVVIEHLKENVNPKDMVRISIPLHLKSQWKEVALEQEFRKSLSRGDDYNAGSIALRIMKRGDIFRAIEIVKELPAGDSKSFVITYIVKELLSNPSSRSLSSLNRAINLLSLVKQEPYMSAIAANIAKVERG